MTLAASLSLAGADALRKAQFKPARDIPVQSLATWDTLQIIQQALSSLENGVFRDAALLMDAMGRDGRISGVMAARVNGVLSMPLQFEPGRGSKAEEIAKEVEDRFDDICPRSEITRLLSNSRMLGFAPGELIWDTKAVVNGQQRWMPRVRSWHPQFVQWRWDTRSFWMITMDGVVPITPGDGQWLFFAPNGPYLSWFTGAIRPIAALWLARWWAYRDWARYSEKHGLPMIKAQVPATAKEEDKERFFNSISLLGTEPTIRIAKDKDGNGFDFMLEEAKSNTWEGFQKWINTIDTEIAVILLGQNLTTEVKGGGSYAAAQVHDQVRADFLAADATTLSNFIREQILKPWAAMNFGDPELAPFPRWNTDPPEGKAQLGAALQGLSQAATGFREAGVPIDWDTLARNLQIPMLEGAEAKKVKDRADKAQETASKPAPSTPPKKKPKKKGDDK